MAALPAAIIYTHSMLAGSMTFIKSHAEALNRFRPVYVGAHRVRGLELPAERTRIVNEGGWIGDFREYLFRRFGYAPALVADLQAYHPRIVHAHFGTSGPAGLSLARRLGLPLLVTFHGKDATLSAANVTRSRRQRELLRGKGALIAGPTAFIAVSEFVRRQLLEQGYPEDRVIVHRNGIDLEYFEPTTIEREPLIVFVGRFVEKKGAGYLVEAAAALARTGLEFRLVLVGDGPLRASLERAAADAGVEAEFPGFLPLEEVRRWLNRACVVAVPSVTARDGDSEGLPTIVLEAQAMATPLVASRHSGIPEGVREGVTAELVAERDVAGLAAALQSFLESPGKREAFGTAGRRFVSEHFDLHAQVEQLQCYYEALYERYAAREAAA